MNVRHLLSTAALAAAISITGQAMAGVDVGDSPEFEFTTLEGTEVSQDTLGGNVVIIDFWATWCGPCIASIPHMEEIYGEYNDLGVEVYGVSVDEDLDALDAFVDENEVPWHIAALGGWEGMAADFGVDGIPSLFVLSPEGEVIWAGHPMGLTTDVMDGIVEEHLDAERPNYVSQSVMSEEGSFSEDDTRTYDGKFVDVYEIELEEGGRYTVSIESDDADTLLAVHSPDGKININDDVAEGNTNSSVSIRGAQGGVYKIYATTFAAEETGDYMLDVDQQVAEGAQN